MLFRVATMAFSLSFLSTAGIASASSQMTNAQTVQANILSAQLTKTSFVDSNGQSVSLPQVQLWTWINGPQVSYQVMAYGPIQNGSFEPSLSSIPASQIQNGQTNYMVVGIAPDGYSEPITDGIVYAGSDQAQTEQIANEQSSFARVTVSQDELSALSGTTAQSQGAHPPDNCIAPLGGYVYVWLHSYTDKYTAIGQVHSIPGLHKVMLSIHHGATATVTAGLSKDFGANFSVDGEVGVTNTQESSIKRPFVNVGNYAHTLKLQYKYDHQSLEYRCWYIDYHGYKKKWYVHHFPWVHVVANNWDGGGYIVGKDVSYMDNWTPKQLRSRTVSQLCCGEEYTTGGQKALTETGAVTAWGFTASATLGFSNSTELSIQAADSGRVCLYDAVENLPVNLASVVDETKYYGNHCQQ